MSSIMIPDPRIVVEALRRIRNGKDYAPWSLDEGWGHRLKKKELQVLAEDALPHAEAIAEMWADLQEPRNMTLAEWKNVHDLITAAREMERAVTEEGCDAGDLVPTCFGGRALPRLRAALENLEEAL